LCSIGGSRILGLGFWKIGPKMHHIGHLSKHVIYFHIACDEEECPKFRKFQPLQWSASLDTYGYYYSTLLFCAFFLIVFFEFFFGEEKA
jgi:hypothetical protein